MTGAEVIGHSVRLMLAYSLLAFRARDGAGIEVQLSPAQACLLSCRHLSRLVADMTTLTLDAIVKEVIGKFA